MLKVSAAEAATYVRKMVAKESNGPGDFEPALHRIAQHSGIGFWTLHHLWKRKAKTVDSSLLGRVKAAYLDLCERQIAAIQLEIVRERAVGGDDDLTDIEAEAEALAEKIAARRALTARPVRPNSPVLDGHSVMTLRRFSAE